VNFVVFSAGASPNINKKNQRKKKRPVSLVSPDIAAY